MEDVNKRRQSFLILVSQNVVVFFNKDVIIIKPLMVAVLLMKIAFWGGNAFWKTVEVALQKPPWVWRGGGGGGSSMTACDFPGY